MKRLRTYLRKSLNDNKGQGTAEYVLLLVIVVALVLMFKDKIRTAMTTKTEEVSQGIEGFNGN